MTKQLLLSLVLALSLAAGCGNDDDLPGFASIKNDFNNPAMAYQPPWTICRSSYMGVDFGPIAIGDTSAEKQVRAGLDYVLLVGAWNDPTCSPTTSLPLATSAEHEIVSGQHETVAMNMASHQGPCPPEGVAPIPEAVYDRILTLWPEFNFQPYATRTQNTECLPSSP
jgi:hypothetical protein